MLPPSEVWVGCFSSSPPLRNLGLKRQTVLSTAQTWGWEGAELGSGTAHTHNFVHCPPPLPQMFSSPPPLLFKSRLRGLPDIFALWFCASLVQAALRWAFSSTALVAMRAKACRDQPRGEEPRGQGGGTWRGLFEALPGGSTENAGQVEDMVGAGFCRSPGEAFVATFALGRRFTSVVTRGEGHLPNLEPGLNEPFSSYGHRAGQASSAADDRNTSGTCKDQGKVLALTLAGSSPAPGPIRRGSETPGDPRPGIFPYPRVPRGSAPGDPVSCTFYLEFPVCGKMSRRYWKGVFPMLPIPEAHLEAKLRHEFAAHQDRGSPREMKPSRRNQGLGAPGPTQETTRPARRMSFPNPTRGNWKAGRRSSLQQAPQNEVGEEGAGTAQAQRVGDAERTPSPAESVPSGAPPPRAPTRQVWTHWGGRRWEGEERRIGGEGRGVLFLLLPAPAEANLTSCAGVGVGELAGRLKIQVSRVRAVQGPRGFDRPVTRFVLMRKTLLREGSEQQRETLICGLKGLVPHLSPPSQGHARARDLLGDARTVSSRTPDLRAPRVPTASGGDVWEKAPRRGGGREPGSGFCDIPTSSSLLEAGRSSPTQLLLASWEESRRRPFHTGPGILLFLTAHQGKA
ncbi:hypothetical protein Cadr_000015631 [Camelus dromedarius]|uniref:Uncharacterized protein n=1 Tax=Camelus dromedarius TaxID=9838 RepID=A0A5N4EA69_CAMDR|nr:hypothetical protein Cadr_000015631 [Camelus dromedarius]